MIPKSKIRELLFILVYSARVIFGFYLSSRTVTTNYGDLRGLIVKPNNRALAEVEVFLGVPYAAPPLGPFRFMPPMTPDKWRGIRRADSMPPVCPQKLPDVTNRRESLKRMPVGRYNYLQRLIPQLRNQSENCLFLNIYTPFRENLAESSQKLPVLVYIHGESYEWNSGNPYDGTVLASYGQILVVTVNFRLGILGFLRPALNEKYVSNFGLLDQIAALHWIRGNIANFGGDPESVTIFGHGTGAALVNLLLISPVAQASKGLFQRAILMSGSALSKWAFTWDPYKYTIQVAKALKCPLLDRGDDLANCLRSKSVEELLAVPLQTPPFTTPLGPIMDGTVIRQDPLRMILSIDSATLSKYDLLYGATSAESFNILNASEVKYGMSRERRNRLLRAYISNTFEHQTSVIYAAVDNEYTTWNSSGRGSFGKRKEMELRDRVLQILSDAQIVAPVVNMGDLHSELNSRSFFYVFNHQSLYGDYPFNQGAVHGEELAYVFGAPLVGGFSHFGLNYTLEEQFLSELVMILWTNFAKTGNPNLPTPQGYKTEGTPFNWMENLRKLWPPYDQMNQQYLHIDMQVVTKSHYRAKKLAVWNRLIPDLISSSTLGVPVLPPRATVPTINLVPTIQPDYKHSLTAPPQLLPYKPVTIPQAPYSPPPYSPKQMKSQHEWKDSFDESQKFSEISASPTPQTYAGTPMSIIILIGIMILFLNCFAMAGIYYKRDKIRFTRTQSDNEKEVIDENATQLSNNEIYSENGQSSKLKVDDVKNNESNCKQFKAGSEFYSHEDLLLDSSRSISSEKLSTLKKKELTSFSTYLLDREGKKALSKNDKSDKKNGKTDTYERKKNKSENSIYSEVNQNSPESVCKKSHTVKFMNEVSLSCKSLNKSSTSITSLKSTSSKASIKSNTSKNSIKNTSIMKTVKKNASCQSLPTPEYCWGISPDIMMGKTNIGVLNDKSAVERQHLAAELERKKYPKVLPDVPYILDIHAATLPKVRPPPIRHSSLTAKEIEELEKMHIIYKKKRDTRGDEKLNSREMNTMEKFYGTGGGEAPASPLGLYNAISSSDDTIKYSKINKKYEHNGIYERCPLYDTYVHKDTQKIPSIAQVSNPASVKSYFSKSDSRSPREPFSKSKANKKVNYEENKSLVSAKLHNILNISTSSSSDTVFSHTVHSSFLTPDVDSSQLLLKGRIQHEDAAHSLLGQHSIQAIYDNENTGTIKKRKSFSSKYQITSDYCEKSLSTAEKPLKSVLKTTSAYDKPKPSTSASSLSSNASITLVSLPGDKMVPLKESNTKSLVISTRAIGTPTNSKSEHSSKESK